MNTALNERVLTAVSGGTDTGKIGPKSEEIIETKQLLQDAMTLIGNMAFKDVFLEEDVKSALNFLKPQPFKPYDAYIYLGRAIPKAVEDWSHDPQRVSLILEKLRTASGILYKVLF